jgi:hypothetical protein
MHCKNVHPRQLLRRTPSGIKIVLESLERDANRINTSHLGRTSVREYRVSRSGAVLAVI